VYRRNVGYVFRLLRRFGVAPGELEDAAQEVFMVVHRRLPEFDPTRGTVRTWLFAIARGVAANRRRSQQRRLRLLPPAPTTDRRTCPESRAGQRQILALVERFLGTLPESQREVFELVDIEGLKGPEVAELLGVKLNTMYTRLRAARLAFKAYIRGLETEIGAAR
jgi:RNA polymerase sigma-70 factor (ECF subfamily)